MKPNTRRENVRTRIAVPATLQATSGQRKNRHRRQGRGQKTRLGAQRKRAGDIRRRLRRGNSSFQRSQRTRRPYNVLALPLKFACSLVYSGRNGETFPELGRTAARIGDRHQAKLGAELGTEEREMIERNGLDDCGFVIG